MGATPCPSQDKRGAPSGWKCVGYEIASKQIALGLSVLTEGMLQYPTHIVFGDALPAARLARPYDNRLLKSRCLRFDH